MRQLLYGTARKPTSQTLTMLLLFYPPITPYPQWTAGLESWVAAVGVLQGPCCTRLSPSVDIALAFQGLYRPCASAGEQYMLLSLRAKAPRSFILAVFRSGLTGGRGPGPPGTAAHFVMSILGKWQCHSTALCRSFTAVPYTRLTDTQLFTAPRFTGFILRSEAFTNTTQKFVTDEVITVFFLPNWPHCFNK